MPWSKGSSAKSDGQKDEDGNRQRLPSHASDTSASTAPGNRPRLPSTGDNSYSSTMSIGSRSKRISSAEERLVKARKTVDSYLRKISNVTGKQYSLNKDSGMCYFPYQRFIVVIEVPADHSDLLYMYSCVCKLNEDDNIMAIMQVAMELNYMQHRTRGGTLGMENSEVNLCLSTPVVGLSPSGLKELIDQFLVTTTEVNSLLERAKEGLASSNLPDRSDRSVRSGRSLSTRGSVSPPPSQKKQLEQNSPGSSNQVLQGSYNDLQKAQTVPLPKTPPVAYRSTNC